MDEITKQNFRFISIIVCTFNRGDYINACLESLLQQTYPKNNYEIIVVDDGSTDGTQIKKSERIKTITHHTNRGLSAARNTGIAAAKGEIIAYIDDDAVADPQWLALLVEPFDSTNVTATGGRTCAYKTDHISERYLSAINSGNPPPLAFGKSKNPLWRFWIYVKKMFSSNDVPNKPTEVQAVFGLNCAYRSTALRAIGGFDESLFAEEDTEVSVRLRNNGAHIIFVPDAIIYHRHRESIIRLVRESYNRASYTVNYYAKEKKVLPIFPLPLLYILVSVVLANSWPIWGFLFIIFGPVLLYSWWPIRALRNHKPEYIVYGYIQLLIEFSAILGLIAGKFRAIKK